jgi:hypothetical protein
VREFVLDADTYGKGIEFHFSMYRGRSDIRATDKSKYPEGS